MFNPVTVEHGPHASAVRASIIIPSWRGEISKLRATIEMQTFQDYELVIVKAVSPAGRARDLGVSQAHGEIIIFIDDDATLGHDRVLEQMIQLLEADPTIGVVGPSKLLPPDATWLQRRIAAQVPRWVYPTEPVDTESNPPLNQYGFTGITTTCCAIRRSLLRAIGGFDQQLSTGEDPELFYRIHRAGYRFVIPGQCWVNHSPPGRIGDLLRKSFRYGIGHAQEAFKNPERRMDIVPLDTWYGKLLLLLSPLAILPLLFVHMYFDPKRHIRIGFKPFKTLATYATLYGYAFGGYQARHAQRNHQDNPAQLVSAANNSASRSSAISGMTFLGIAVLNNLYALIMARLLTVHSFGVLGLAQSCLLIAATLLNSGFPLELARAIAGTRSPHEAYRAAKSALAGNTIVAAAFCITLIGTAWMGWLHFETEGPMIVGLLLLEVPLLALAAVWAGVLQGQLRFGVIGVGRLIEALIKVAVGIALVFFGLRATGAVAATVLGTAASVVVLAWGARHFAFWRERSWGDWRSYRSSLTLFAGLCALTVISNIDIIGINLFSPKDQAATVAGYYQSAAVLARIPLLLAGAYAAALFPYVSRSQGSKLAIYVAYALKYTLLLIVPLNLILIAIPEASIRLFFPAAYAASADALRIAAIGTLLLALTTVLTMVLQARNLARSAAISLLAAALVEVVALGVLVPRYGAEGAAGSLLLAGAIACAALSAVYMRHFAWQTHLFDMIGYGLACAALVAVLVLLPHDGLWAVTTSAAALAVYMLVLAVMAVFTAADLNTILSGVPLERVPLADQARAYSLSVIGRLNQLFGIERPDHANFP